jgi:DNA polymerase-1
MEKPNFQNIPSMLSEDFKHLSIRRCVVARPGYKLLVADLSQIELRVCGHVTLDPLFLKAYRDWQCTNCGTTGTSISDILHVCPNCACPEEEKILKKPEIKVFWHGLDLHRMTADGISALGGDRQLGKQCNFALIYLASGRRMHYEHPSLSIEEWDTIIEGFMRKYSGVRKWHIQMEEWLKSVGICTDVFGRKRRISKKDIHMNFKHALNMFVNFPIQSSACAYIELAQANIRQETIKTSDWMNTIYPINFVHDEVCYEVKDEDAHRHKATVQRYLETSVKFKVPIRADVKLVDSWDKAKG